MRQTGSAPPNSHGHQAAQHPTRQTHASRVFPINDLKFHESGSMGLEFAFRMVRLSPRLSRADRQTDDAAVTLCSRRSHPRIRQFLRKLIQMGEAEEIHRGSFWSAKRRRSGLMKDSTGQRLQHARALTRTVETKIGSRVRSRLQKRSAKRRPGSQDAGRRQGQAKPWAPKPLTLPVPCDPEEFFMSARPKCCGRPKPHCPFHSAGPGA